MGKGVRKGRQVILPEIKSRGHTPWEVGPEIKSRGHTPFEAVPEIKSRCHTPWEVGPEKKGVGKGPRSAKGEDLPEVNRKKCIIGLPHHNAIF